MLYLDEAEDLVLLILDTGRIGAAIRFEPVPGWAELFPHIYGPLEMAAVAGAVPFKRDQAGTFCWPGGLARP
jgi:uncharacterized protein (DUF952 family)